MQKIYFALLMCRNLIEKEFLNSHDGLLSQQLTCAGPPDIQHTGLNAHHDIIFAALGSTRVSNEAKFLWKVKF